ncbi:uncharacterized protein BKA55DRAFT_578955 [Fusarium redolens]|uniref:Uncharacterized protein n=1 Tax=Fusarium redolens TaxID=48865 RepID=A0A9P9GEF5_FUSRE|nr:uncharacterized protein BKA55DRAFT_578955 [Fusarium redolens]KAH7237020.1 hypothetical protein BKA55DRAFT_578955 [Fusarium redolens]
MDQDTNTYAHQALTSHDSIRILHLLPGSDNDVIRCSSEEMVLDEAEGRYEAVSYDCGRSYITSTIVCDSAALPVTTNLELGLRTFRLKLYLHFPRVMPTKGICQMQNDHSHDRGTGA